MCVCMLFRSERKIEMIQLSRVPRGGKSPCLCVCERFSALTRKSKTFRWEDTIKKFGSGSLTMAEILEPARRLAEEVSVLNHESLSCTQL